MVTIEQVRASNAQIATCLPPGLVAVFVGATNGVGEAAVKQFAKHAVSPRVYLLGRSKDAGQRIVAECEARNPQGTFTFISKDLSLLRNVDEVCREILAKESHVNVLFLTIGTLQVGMNTAENLHYPAALVAHARNRFIVNLLPLIRKAPHIRRVVSVFLGAMESNINMNDFQGRSIGLLENKGHAASITTLTLEHHAATAPEVAFLHDFPGPVKGGILRGTKGFGFGLVKVASKFILPMVQMPSQDAGDRHVYYTTSARYPARIQDETCRSVPLSDGLEVAAASDGNVGGGVYSVFLDGEPLKQPARNKLAELRRDGTLEKVWGIIERDFVNITGTKCI